MDCRVCTQGPYECIIIMKAMLYHMLPPVKLFSYTMKCSNSFSV